MQGNHLLSVDAFGFGRLKGLMSRPLGLLELPLWVSLTCASA